MLRPQDQCHHLTKGSGGGGGCLNSLVMTLVQVLSPTAGRFYSMCCLMPIGWHHTEGSDFLSSCWCPVSMPGSSTLKEEFSYLGCVTRVFIIVVGG